MDLFRRRCEDMQSYADLLVSICNENGFSHWRNYGRILNGWAAICRGHADSGTEVLRDAVAGWQIGGARLWVPMFRILEAEGHVKAGRDEAALQAIEQALAICEDTGLCWTMAEVLRTKACILLSAGRAQSGEVEAILLDSLKIARRQQARSWELRTACDLARLWQRQGRNSEALRLLESVCDQFAEGFDTRDLKDAKALLRCLRREVGRKPRERSSTRVVVARDRNCWKLAEAQSVSSFPDGQSALNLVAARRRRSDEASGQHS
jgi:predicted ATPase